MAFRVDEQGGLIAFAGSVSTRITVDGRATIFADAPFGQVASAARTPARRVAGGAWCKSSRTARACCRPRGALPESVEVVAEGPAPGTWGAIVPSRRESECAGIHRGARDFRTLALRRTQEPVVRRCRPRRLPWCNGFRQGKTGNSLLVSRRRMNSCRIVALRSTNEGTCFCADPNGIKRGFYLHSCSGVLRRRTPRSVGFGFEEVVGGQRIYPPSRPAAWKQRRTSARVCSGVQPLKIVELVEAADHADALRNAPARLGQVRVAAHLRPA